MTPGGATRCPLCAAHLPSADPSACRSCGAPVGGDTGRRLLALDRHIARITDERRQLAARLRHETEMAATRRGAAAAGVIPGRRPPPRAAAAASADAVVPRRPVPALGALLAPVRAWLADSGPQALLAAGGVLLLVVAAGVFLAVTWRDLPVPARGGVVLGAAVGSGRLTAVLVGRGLARTAEATGVLTLALLAVLADGLWRADLLDVLGRDVGVLTQVTAVLAVTAHAFARVSGARSPLVLAAWLTAVAIHASGVWLLDPYAAVGVTSMDLLAAQAINLVAVGAAGVYATRVLTSVPRWRLATLVATGVLWTATTAVVLAVIASLTPGEPSDRPALVAGLAVATASVGVAAAARRIGGPRSRWWAPVGTGGMWWAGTLTGAAALAGRTPAWPDMPALLPLAVGVALLTRVRQDAERGAALLGMIPLGAVALRPVVGSAQWLASTWAVPVATGEHVVGLASCLGVCLLAGAAAVLVRRGRIPALAVAIASWLVAVAGGGLTLAVLAPSDPAQSQPFIGCLAVVAGAVALAGLAGRASGGAAAVWWPAGVAFALTAGAAGALAGRVPEWPELPVVASLALASAVVWTRRDRERVAAVVGAVPSMLATGWLASAAIGQIGGVAIRAMAPDVVGTASLTAICAIALGMAAAVDRVMIAATADGGADDGARPWSIGVPERGARGATLATAGVAWSVACVAATVDLARLAPSRPADLAPFVLLAVLAAVLAGLAWAAGSLDLVSIAAAAGGMSFVTTAAVAAITWGRVPGWTDLPAVAAATVGAALVWSFRSRSAQWGALVGAAPVLVAALVPVARVVVWYVGELAWRVAVPWPSAPGPVDAPPPTPVLASAIAIGVLVAAVARRMVGRRVSAFTAAGLCGAASSAAAAAAWPVAGGAAVGVVVSAGAVALLWRRPDDPAPALLLASTAGVSAIASLTAPAVTVVTLAVGAGVTAAAVGRVQGRAAATTAGVCTAQVLGLTAAVAATMSRGPGAPGLSLVVVAGSGWLVAATVRSRVEQAAAVEATASVAMVTGLVLAWAADARTLGIALAAVATVSAAVATWRPDRRWMRWLSSGAASGSSWSMLSAAGVSTVEAYTAPPALLISGLAAAGLVRDPGRSSWLLLGSALSLLTLPTLLQLLDDPSDLPRLAAAVTIGAALAAVGRRWSLQSPLMIGVGTAAAAALTQYGAVLDVLPRWLLLALGGALLLWLSISYERQVERVTAARRQVVAMR